MSFINKILGQTMPGPVLTSLYVAPPSTMTTATIIICNQGSFADTYRVAVAPAGAANEAKHYIVFDKVILANSSDTINNIHLISGDVLRVYGSVSEISFTAVGSENQ